MLQAAGQVAPAICPCRLESARAASQRAYELRLQREGGSSPATALAAVRFAVLLLGELRQYCRWGAGSRGHWQEGVSLCTTLFV